RSRAPKRARRWSCEFPSPTLERARRRTCICVRETSSRCPSGSSDAGGAGEPLGADLVDRRRPRELRGAAGRRWGSSSGAARPVGGGAAVAPGARRDARRAWVAHSAVRRRGAGRGAVDADSAGAAAGAVGALTVDVPATWLALARLVACTALLVTAAGLTRSRGQARRILAFIAGVGALIAVVAFVQRALHIDKIFGVYQPRSTPGFGVFGTFVDVNHAAALFSLAALIAAGMAFELRGGARALAASVAVLTSAALLVSTSRSGALGLLVGGFLLALFLAARRIGVLRAIGVASLLMLLATATAVWSNEALRDRVWGHEQLFANQKTRGWADGVRLAE